MTFRARPALAAAAVAALTAVWLAPAGCVRRARGPLARVEALFEEARWARDRIDLARARAAPADVSGTPVADLAARYGRARAALRDAVAVTPRAGLAPDDERALAVIERTLERDLVEETAAPPSGAAPPAECAYDPGAVAVGDDPFEALSARMYACFGQAAARLPFEGETLDRLTIFTRLPLTDDPARRRRLFMALAPVWRSIHGEGGTRSPYRALLRLSVARREQRSTPIEGAVRELGIDPLVIEEWLVAVLQAWRDATPGPLIEPWDFAYAAGRASRALSPRVGLADLRPVNDRYYADLGADPARLGIRYDLEPRPGKDPVAFTTFGARARAGDDGRGAPTEPWVFASYAVGGIDNLSELLHETGHAVHIAAIRTRPAFLDWPDSDTFTEAVAEMATLELYEPAWQRRYLGDAVPLVDALRARYAGIVLDVAWALLEIRLHHDPSLDPNRVWGDLTHRYLRVRPHPELSWWAMRGQLVNLPGYMLNYAAGAILIADLRARARELRGPWTEGDPGWYPWVADRLFRFGLERPTREVIEEFLGRPVRPDAILADMARLRP